MRTATRAAILASAATIIAVILLAETAIAAAWPLDPRGTGASKIAGLWWLMFALGLAVFIVVMALVFVAIRQGRAKHRTGEASGFPGPRFVVIGGIIIPFAILTVVFGYTLWVAHGLADDGNADLTIVVEGRQFWWHVTYPDHDVVTANEIHIPVGLSVDVQLITADVIHSFWVPKLHGKLDLMPGQTNTLRLNADEAGEYRGQCAEFCGEQHANMAFLVIAQSPDEFDRWISQQQQVPAEPSDPMVKEGQQAFLGSACVVCHTVRGTNASGDLGPDLTHLASRRTLAAGTLENNRGNLAGWILDPQSIKPGNLMPATNLAPDQLHAILDYLESLGPGETTPASPSAEATPEEEATPAAEEATPSAAEQATPEEGGATADEEPQTEITVEMVDIDFNPNEFTIAANTDVTIILPNLGDLPHNFHIDELDIHSEDVEPGGETTITINAEPGEYTFYCSIPGHREAGMEGTLIVE